MKPAIIIVTYNRIDSFKRLLGSIKNANYDYTDIPLVISIDGGGNNNNEILQVAKEFHWEHGEKEIISHQENLGLRKHILSCGNLTDIHGSVIILEDDIIVNKQFYNYSKSAVEFYDQDDNIAGIGLYSYHWNIHANFPFTPIKIDSDTYFLQYPASWGQCWTRDQWLNFRKWYDMHPKITKIDKIPHHVKGWPESSWMKYFIKYMVDLDKYFVYPYVSYTTNFSDSGTHNKISSVLYQVPFGDCLNTNFKTLSTRSLRYDVYFEIHPDFLKISCSILKDYEFEVDLYGMKQLSNIGTRYLISTKKCSNPIMQFSYLIKPHEQNIIYRISEYPCAISLGSKDQFKNENHYFLQQDYFNSINGIKNLLSYFIKKLMVRVKHRLYYMHFY